MKAGGYVPDCGDAIWLNFDPQAGRGQAGRRPAVVLSPNFTFFSLEEPQSVRKIVMLSRAAGISGG